MFEFGQEEAKGGGHIWSCEGFHTTASIIRHAAPAAKWFG